jgi:multidrug resistance protein, MATE family
MKNFHGNKSLLTKYPSASFRELVTLSYPLMISALSGLLMFFSDRLFLANYSLDALNAAVLGSMAANIFCYGMLSISSIAEVFVATKNGAGNYHAVSNPVWQMVWFSLIMIPAAIMIAIFLSPNLFRQQNFGDQARDYFRILMLFGPVNVLSAAFGSFFLGTGKVKIVMLAALVANAINIILDYMLIFGHPPLFPSLGIEGAGFATGIAQLMQLFIVAMVFLSAKNRQKYKTSKIQFDSKLFWQCLKVALPRAMGQMIDLAAWTLVLFLLAMAGKLYISVVSIGQSIIFLFAFVSMGLEKASTNIFANLIGSQKTKLLFRLMGSAIKLNALFAAIIFIPLIIYSETLISIFINTDYQSQAAIIQQKANIARLVWIYIFTQGIAGILSGILTAYKFTSFILFTNTISGWLFAVLPTYLFINQFGFPPISSWVIMDSYIALVVLIFSLGVWWARKRFHIIKM